MKLLPDQGTRECDRLIAALSRVEVHVQPATFHPRSGDCTARLGTYNAGRILDAISQVSEKGCEGD